MPGSSFGSPDQCRSCSLRFNHRSHHHAPPVTSLLPLAGFESGHVRPDDRRVQLCVCICVLVHSRFVALRGGGGGILHQKFVDTSVMRSGGFVCSCIISQQIIDVLLIHTLSSHRRCRNAVSIISICCPSFRTLLPHVYDDATGEVPSCIPLTKP